MRRARVRREMIRRREVKTGVFSELSTLYIFVFPYMDLLEIKVTKTEYSLV